MNLYSALFLFSTLSPFRTSWENHRTKAKRKESHCWQILTEKLGKSPFVSASVTKFRGKRFWSSETCLIGSIFLTLEIQRGCPTVQLYVKQLLLFCVYRADWLKRCICWELPLLNEAQRTMQRTQDELVNIIYMAEATQRLALHNNDKASRA